MGVLVQRLCAVGSTRNVGAGITVSCVPIDIRVHNRDKGGSGAWGGMWCGSI